jgi:hypothetical protein
MNALRRVLVSSMDAGAAHHMVQLVQLLAATPGFSVSLHACHAAAGVFANAGLAFKPFDVLPANPPQATPGEVERMIAHAAAVIADDRPDLVIGGLSNTGAGPDEAFGAAARAAGCVTATLLDDRGPLFTLDGRYAEHLLATSTAILAWAKNVQGPKLHMIGSLKHHALSLLPADDIRKAVRARMGLNDSTRLVTFIAQSDAMEGHNEKFSDLINILERDHLHLPSYRLAIRVHPGAPSAGLWCWEEAMRRGLPAECDRGEHNILDLLAASDVVFSCSSTSMTDYIWLSLGGRLLTAVPVYLLGGSVIRDWLVATQGTWVPDLVTRGLALIAADHDELAKHVHRGLGGTLTAPNPDRNSIRDMPDPFGVSLQVVRAIIGLDGSVRHKGSQQ